MAANVATEFRANAYYAAKDLVMYEGILYRFLTSHDAGAWNQNQVEPVDNTTEQQLTRILAGMDNAEKAADYADTIVLAPAQITGTRYKYVLTNAPDPRQ